MEIFGDNDSDADEAIDLIDVLFVKLINMAFVEAMRMKSSIRRSVEHDSIDHLDGRIEIIMHRKIAILFDSDEYGYADQLRSRLIAAKFSLIAMMETKSMLADSGGCFDAVFILAPSFARDQLTDCQDWLGHGGILVVILTPQSLGLFPQEQWKVLDSSKMASGKTGEVTVVAMSKRTIRNNPSAAIYWSTSAEAIEHERCLLDKIIIPLSVAERELGKFSDNSYKRAVECLAHFGVCIFPGLFNRSQVLERGHRAKEDLQEALIKLKGRGLDLLRPLKQGQRIDNFHELSMREALRCDIRNGRHMKSAAQDDAVQFSGSERGSKVSADKFGLIKDSNVDDAEKNRRFDAARVRDLHRHEGLLDVLMEVMNPPGGEDSRGNWGRWNFEGPGPDAGPPPLAVGQVAAVMSMPGCADQTIHADTSHIFVHTQLPGHYFNLFIPAVDGPEETSYEAGDALVFDCRILHFGLANQRVDNPVSSSTVGSQSADSSSTRKCACAEVCNCEMDSSSSHLSSPSPLSFTSLEASLEAIADIGSGDSMGREELPSIRHEWLEEVAYSRRRWRPLLYVNYHQQWFHDPKNWNDKERLFPDGL